MKRILKKNKYVSFDGINYQRNDMPNKSNLDKSISEEEDKDTRIVQELIDFVETEQECGLSEEDSKILVHDFCLYILDKSICNTRYFNSIAKFILSKKSNSGDLATLTKIKAGMVLYSGLTYESEDKESTSWTEKITLILNTDILFSIVGYNGEICKRCVGDFLELVKMANGNNKTPLIRLRFLEPTAHEINEYFANAIDIVKGKGYARPTSTAMKTIVSKCKSESDVLIEKGVFWDSISNLNIESQPCDIDYNTTDSHFLNIESLELLEDVAGKDEEKTFKDIELLNSIHFLRKGVCVMLKDKARYTLITEKRALLTLSKKIRDEKSANSIALADDLESYISYLWFKLNRRLKGTALPTSFDVILRTQRVLSSSLGEKIVSLYNDTQEKYACGMIDKQTMERSLVALNQYNREAESISQDNIEEVIDTINNLSLANIEKEYLDNQREREELKKLNKKQGEELEILHTENNEYASQVGSLQSINQEMSETIIEQGNTIKMMDLELIQYKQREYESIRAPIVRKQMRKYYFRLLLFPTIMIAVGAISIVINSGKAICRPFNWLLPTVLELLLLVCTKIDFKKTNIGYKPSVIKTFYTQKYDKEHI